ncbi:hypothetical protein Tco_1086380 [Tanacetum coccineum]
MLASIEVMSTPAYVDSKTITQADGAQNSRPEEAPLEAEESQLLGSRVPLMGEEFEASEPSGLHVWSCLPSRKRYRSFYETPSPSSSPTLPIHKRYRGTSELILDTKTKDESSDSDAEGEGSEDEGPGSDKEEDKAAPEGH